MTRKHRNEVEVSITLEVNGEDVDCTARGTPEPGEADSYSRTYGWTPGSAPSVTDIEVETEEGAVVDFDALSKRDRDRVEEALLLEAEEADIARAEAAEDDRVDAYRERRLGLLD